MKSLIERINSLSEEQAKSALIEISHHHSDLVAIAVTGYSKKNENKEGQKRLKK